jgi:hypothetical protein
MADPVGPSQCSAPGDSVHYSVLSPNGGETVQVGDTVTIRVCSENPAQYDLSDAPVSLSVDGGKTWIGFGETIAAEQNADYTEMTFAVPGEVSIYAGGEFKEVSLVSSECLVKIEAYTSETSGFDWDISDAFFSIVPNPNKKPDPVADNDELLIISPNGGETFRVGDGIEVEFGYADFGADAEIVLTLIRTDEPTFMVQMVPNSLYMGDSPHTWTIPYQIMRGGEMVPFPTGENVYRIRISEYNGTYYDDYSDETFSIVQ